MYTSGEKNLQKVNTLKPSVPVVIASLQKKQQRIQKIRFYPTNERIQKVIFYPNNDVAFQISS